MNLGPAILLLVLSNACGDLATVSDGRTPPPGLSVNVTAPNGGEGFYQADSVTVLWIPFDDIAGDVTCDVEARGATTIVIADDVSAPPNRTVTTSWAPAGVEPGLFKIVVTCTDAGARTATDESDLEFAITPPPQAVSFSGVLQPILTATCLGGPCHPATNPQANLNLTAGAAHADLVGAPSTQCAQKLVEPGDPQNSYLIAKMIGANAYGCYFGDLMPKVDQPLQPDVLQLFRDWIANGAPNN